MRIDEYYPEYEALHEYFFPVGLHDIYFDTYPRPQDNNRRVVSYPHDPVYAPKFVAVADEERRNMLACVSPSYTIITNEWAYKMGIKIAHYIFPYSDKPVFWRGWLSSNRGACIMDIRVYMEIKIAEVEHVWFAFVRMKNSYDCSCHLSYEVGFSMEMMDNQEMPIGLLIPSLSLKFSANHVWKQETIERKLEESVRSCYNTRNIFNEFLTMIETLQHIEVVDDEILPLFCRLAKLSITSLEDDKGIELAHKVIHIEQHSKSWISKCGPNAYAALCAYADFAVKYAKDISFLEKKTEFQSQLGLFVDELVVAKEDRNEEFSLYDFIGKQAMEVRKKIKLMCH